MGTEFWMDILQMSYWFTFLLAAAGTVYFILERGTAGAGKGVGTTAALIAFITALQYYGMRDMVGFTGGFGYPTEHHFLGWMLVFPMIVLMVQKHLGMKREGTVARVAIATFLMVFFAWSTEFHGHAWFGFWLTFIAWAFVAYHVHNEFTFKAGSACCKKYMVFGWLVFPLGALAHVTGQAADVMMWREVLYVATDIVLVLSFAHGIVTAGRK